MFLFWLLPLYKLSKREFSFTFFVTSTVQRLSNRRSLLTESSAKAKYRSAEGAGVLFHQQKIYGRADALSILELELRERELF